MSSKSIGPKTLTLCLVKENPGLVFPGCVSVFCWTADELIDVLKYNKSSILKLGCTNKVLIEVASFLSNNSDFDTIFYLTNQTDLLWPVEIEEPKWIEVTDEKQLKRRLYYKAMIYHYTQGIEHKKIGNIGLSDLSFDEVQKLQKQLQISC